MYPRRPLDVFTTGVTAAAAGASATLAVLAAPGATRAYRLVGFLWMLEEPEPAANVFRFLLDAGGGTFYGGTTISNGTRGSDALWLPEPGRQITINTPLNVLSFCTAVARPFQVTAYYYIDDVT